MSDESVYKRDVFVIIVVAVMLFGAMIIGCTRSPIDAVGEVLSKPDNFVEEILEGIIFEETGVDFDFSSDSPEN